mgnify:CR=1
MSATAYVGSAFPESLQMTVRAASSGVSLATVTSAVIEARAPSGAEKTWAATVSDATTASVRVIHAFDDDGTDIDEQGRWYCYAEVTLANGDVHRSRTGFLIAVGRFG